MNPFISAAGAARRGGRRVPPRRVAQLQDGGGEGGAWQILGSLTLVVTVIPLIPVRHGVGIGECSVTTAFALYGAPFFRMRIRDAGSW